VRTFLGIIAAAVVFSLPGAVAAKEEFTDQFEAWSVFCSKDDFDERWGCELRWISDNRSVIIAIWGRGETRKFSVHAPAGISMLAFRVDGGNIWAKVGCPQPVRGLCLLDKDEKDALIHKMLSGEKLRLDVHRPYDPQITAAISLKGFKPALTRLDAYETAIAQGKKSLRPKQ
jgi:invasion protein IalB